MPSPSSPQKPSSYSSNSSVVPEFTLGLVRSPNPTIIPLGSPNYDHHRPNTPSDHSSSFHHSHSHHHFPIPISPGKISLYLSNIQAVSH
jgi:hypothetical protein